MDKAQNLQQQQESTEEDNSQIQQIQREEINKFAILLNRYSPQKLDFSDIQAIQSLSLEINKDNSNQDLIEIQQVILFMANLKVLKLNFKSKTANFTEFAKIFDQLPNLKVLELLIDLKISEKCIQDTLFNSFHRLQLDSFKLNLQQIESEQQLQLFGYGIKQLISLKSLKVYLYLNQFNRQYCQDLKDFLSNLDSLKNITKFKIGIDSGNVKQKGVEDILNQVQKMPDLIDLRLIFRDTRLGLEGSEAFRQGFQNLSQLQQLRITLRNSYMGKQGYSNLSYGISYLSQLRYLMIVTEDNLGNDFYEVLIEKIHFLKQLIYAKLKLYSFNRKQSALRLFKSLRLTMIKTE